MAEIIDMSIYIDVISHTPIWLLALSVISLVLRGFNAVVVRGGGPAICAGIRIGCRVIGILFAAFNVSVYNRTVQLENRVFKLAFYIVIVEIVIVVVG